MNKGFLRALRRRRTLTWFCVAALIPLPVIAPAWMGFLRNGDWILAVAEVVFFPGAVVIAAASIVCTGHPRTFFEVPFVAPLLYMLMFGSVGACIAVATKDRDGTA